MADSGSRTSKWDPRIMTMMKRRKKSRDSSTDATDAAMEIPISSSRLQTAQIQQNIVEEPTQCVPNTSRLVCI